MIAVRGAARFVGCHYDRVYDQEAQMWGTGYIKRRKT
jgi:hypothetical protein